MRREARERQLAITVFYVTVDGRLGLYLVRAVGSSQVIQPLKRSNFIRTGNATNRLSINVQGGSITIAVNDASIASYPLAITTPGEIGLIAMTPDNGNASVVGIDAAFSNLRLTVNP